MKIRLDTNYIRYGYATLWLSLRIGEKYRHYGIGFRPVLNRVNGRWYTDGLRFGWYHDGTRGHLYLGPIMFMADLGRTKPGRLATRRLGPFSFAHKDPTP